MFRTLGHSVASRPVWWLAVWLLVIAVAAVTAPKWSSVVKDGEFGFLPDNRPSRQGETLFAKAFPEGAQASSVVVVVRRVQPAGLTDDDRHFINEVLVPPLQALVTEDGVGTESQPILDASDDSLIARVRSPADELTGPRLVSDDGQAALVVVELRSDFLDLRNRQVLKQIESVLTGLQKAQSVPAGLEIHLSGGATSGRDYSQSRAAGARATDLMTVLLVIVLLVIIHRAPLPALIPLLTVVVAVKLSQMLLSLLAEAGVIGLFDGVEVYIKVIVYGAGVDYCMFLTARYREELNSGLSGRQAVAAAISHVGEALTASAGTVIGGIGMLIFAEFGKFREAGVAIAFSLVVVWWASLTLSSALLSLAGRWAFWPYRIATVGAPPVASERQTGWHRVAQMVLRHPGWMLVVCVGAMLPTSVLSVVYRNDVSYGLLSNLATDAPSVVGTCALQAHFPVGVTGPLTVLIHSETADFREPEGAQMIEQFADRLKDRQSELRLVDVREITHPLGITAAASRAWENLSPRQTILRRGVLRTHAAEHFVSQADSLAGHVARVELVFEHDPVSRESIDNLDHVEPLLRAELRQSLPPDATLNLLGATASIRDLKNVRASDQIRISILVCVSIFLILVLLLRQPLVSLYLIVSVLFSYAATYGATWALFWVLDPAGFAGLDWKLPLLLFTILVAVGEDYNIFLISRVTEEQSRHGPVQGVIVALTKTGGIISSCGVIMAGTFSALLFGSLASMRQLGFALAFGVLLDTFVVRPILVPAFLVLWYGRGANAKK